MKPGIHITLFTVLILSSALAYAQVQSDTSFQWNKLKPNDSLILEQLEVNSSWDDYAPVIVTGNRLLFTSNRRSYESHASALDFNENVYVTTFTGKTWTAAVKHYFFNTDDQTAIAGIDAQGNRLYLYKTFNNGDIYISELAEGQWKKPVHAQSPINSEEHEQSIALAGNTVVISSERSGGRGKHDIYSAVVSSSGAIGEMMPVTSLNTAGDEVDVRLSRDGKRLWFSSNGRSDSLGYDIFVSEAGSNGLWQTPVRMIEPINSSFDDRGFFDADTIFLFSSNRPGGAGGEDLYKGSLYIAPKVPDIELPYATAIDTLFVVKTFKAESQTTGDTSGIQPPRDRFDELGNYMDSLGIKEYYAMVQIGAFYGLSVADFKASYPSLKKMDITTETGVKANGGKITRFLINQKFATLKEAAQLQDEMIRKHKIRDAFVAIYNLSGQRVAIYNSFTGEFIMLKK